MAAKKQKFIIIGSGRSGSTMLKNLLRSHPHITCFGELLNYKKILWDYENFNDVYNTEEIHNIRNSNPTEFIKMVYSLIDDVELFAIGFKSLYAHFDYSRNFKSILLYLLEQPDIKFLHNKRRNLFKTFCSYKNAAERTKQGKFMNAYDKDDVEHSIQIYINYDACLNFFEKTKKMEAKYDQIFKDKSMIDVFYEDLAKKTGFEMKKVLNFIGVDYAPLSLSTYKVRRQPISEVVVNYQELKKKFNDVGFGEYFVE